MATPESQHWYYPNGSPAYEVPGAKGQPVTPDVRHARKLGLLPSVTSIMKVLAAPGLERWKREQAILAALTLTRLPDETDKDFLRRVDDDARAHGEQRANEGKEIHKAIERALGGHIYDPKWTEHVAGVQKLLADLPDSFVGDFKTKESLDGKVAFYDEHIMQLAAYRKGLWSGASQPEWPIEGPRLRCESSFAHEFGFGGRVDVHTLNLTSESPLVSIMISVNEPGKVLHKIWSEDEAQRGWQMFEHALRLWQLRNRI